MTSEVHAPRPFIMGSTTFPGISDSANFSPEELQKVIDFRDFIRSGKHPRFKPPPDVTNTIDRPKPPASAPTGLTAPEKAKLPARPPPPAVPSAKKEQKIEDVLLMKSEVLMRAEEKMKRNRLEKELGNQIAQKKHYQQLSLQVQDGYALPDEEVDLDDALEKAGVVMRPIERPEDPVSISKLVGFYGEMKEEERRQDAYQDDDLQNVRGLQESHNAPPPSSATSQIPSRVPSRASDRKREYEKAPAQPRDPRVPASDSLRRAAMDGASSQTADQPRYVATASGVRSPAAPQPIRPANMARVESQDHLVELDAASVEGYPYTAPTSRGRSPTLGRSGRNSPQAFIKPEPMSPYRKEWPARQPPSPRMEAYRVPPPSLPAPVPRPYDYEPEFAPPAPPPRYPPTYDGYGYREASYPPPTDYRRPYPPYGAPPPTAAYYPPPPATYEEYERHGSRPPHVMPRRSPSPAQPHPPPPPSKRPRRNSRSLSPGRRPRATPVRSPTPSERLERRSDRGFSRPPPPLEPSRRDERPVYDRAPPPRVDPYAPPEYPPHPPPPRPYYDGRDPYYPAPPPPRYMEEHLVSPRPESAMIPRENDFRSYRDREPYPRALLPPAGYPPLPPHPPMLSARPDYRAPSRAMMAPPPLPPPAEIPEYPPRDYYGRPVHPHNPADYVRGASVRPPDERAYLPPREASVRPDLPPPPAGYYGDVGGYRPQSVRPPVAGMGHPPPPPPPPQYGYDDYRGRY
ncbi:hypothetical protein EX30DRAFT_398669 [Ascodesmis nigricans]|uniref:Uncharacterized protein n=1 Tax=Ascodesmis nigricans TaxID=341454 RepID=A0A4S2MJZ7_9PEZI|nr:hypothetical protein EX30DRAFT_398669 [Ascodesmis nigricans]